MKKKCIIVNGQASYMLYVDFQSIPFLSSVSADYFHKHYLSLGYEVIRMNHNINSQRDYNDLRRHRNCLRDESERLTGREATVLIGVIKTIDRILELVERENPEWQNEYIP